MTILCILAFFPLYWPDGIDCHLGGVSVHRLVAFSHYNSDRRAEPLRHRLAGSRRQQYLWKKRRKPRCEIAWAQDETQRDKSSDIRIMTSITKGLCVYSSALHRVAGNIIFFKIDFLKTGFFFVFCFNLIVQSTRFVFFVILEQNTCDVHYMWYAY